MSAAHRQGDGVLVKLDRLDSVAVGDLAAAVLGVEVDPAVVDVVFAETEGLPFFVIEYLTSIREGRPESVDVPDILESRLAGLSDIARQVASAAAVIGRSFDAESLRSVCGRSDDEVVTALEELLKHGVVREPGGGATGYDFSHELLRRHVLGSTSLARRRLLHQRTAAVLAGRHRRDPGAMAAQIGFHFESAGNDHEAADQYAMAAQRAAASTPTARPSTYTNARWRWAIRILRHSTSPSAISKHSPVCTARRWARTRRRSPWEARQPRSSASWLRCTRT